MLTRRLWLAAAPQTIDHELRELATQAPLAMRFKGRTPSELAAWQKSFRATLAGLLGPFAPPARWTSTVERTVDAGDYQRQELLLKADGRRDLPVHLLLPKSATRRPGILALHGHGPFGHDAVAGIDDTEARRQDIASAHYDYGRQLAQRGYAVIVPCFTPMGRRVEARETYRGDDPCAVTFVRMQLLGRLLMGENLHDALWALEHLARQPQVDAARLGCVGLSLGGRMAMLTTALEPRIRVAVCSGALNMLQERIQQRYSCGAQVIPGLLKYGDVPEIASLIAPRPCLWETGRQDKLMVPEWIPGALERMKLAWTAAGSAAAIPVDSFEGGHRWNGVLAYPLLATTLRP